MIILTLLPQNILLGRSSKSGCQLLSHNRPGSSWSFATRSLLKTASLAGFAAFAAAMLLMFLLHRVIFGLGIDFHAITHLLFTDRIRSSGVGIWS
jgi:hypothetical protein